MIIIRRDKLEICDPDTPVMKSILPEFNFSEHDATDVQMLVKVLFTKMQELGGIGLSANQLGLPYRVFVMGSAELQTAVFNPEILEYLGEPETFKEGCLSYPGLFMQIKRPPAIKVKYQNVDAEVREKIFTGLTARVFQHEFDHMQGRDFTAGVSKLKLKMAQERYQRNRKKLIKKHAVKTMLEALKNGQEDSERV